ncbi:MAG: Gfo/Idh/MocA family oxidoreductase [Candidatus Omnitrophota bacterium]
MKMIRTGIIGCGTIFPMHARSLMNLKGVKLVSVCDIKADRARAKAKEYGCKYYTDYKKMLSREPLDVVHVLTPHYMHMPMVIEAAKNKINILTEKPMGLDPKEAEKEIDAAKKNKVVLGVIFQNRFNPGSRLVKKRIEDGSLGKMKSAKLVLTYHKPDSYYKKSDWKGRKNKEGGGVVIDQAIHFLDILRWLTPSDIDYVEAKCANRMHTFINVEDSAEGIIMFKSGFYVCFYLMNFYSYDDDPVIEIDCEKAKVHIIKDSAYIGYRRGGKEKAEPKKNEYIDYGNGVKSYWGYCHYNEIKDYYDSLSKGKKPAVTAEDAKKTQDLVWAIYESSKRNKRIYL